MFDKYLNDYYIFKVDVKEIAELEECTPSTFNRWLKRNGHTPRQKWFAKIDTGIKELDKVLHDRYIYMLKRCKYKRDDRYERYKTMEYMPVYEYVEFCNNNKEVVTHLWYTYVGSGRKTKYAISLDRIDNNKGYLKDNVKFVTHGFNSWKRSVFPIKVTHDGRPDYFLTKEDASLNYGLRRQSIGEVYNNNPYHVKGYMVEESTVEEVLMMRKMESLFDYYQIRERNDY